MSDDGKAINEMFRQMRRFLNEVGKLLQTADGQLDKGGWKPIDAKLISASGRVDKAEEWVPYNATRFYIHERTPTTLVYVFVLFDYYDDGSVTVQRLEEPLISCGIMSFRSKDEVDWVPWQGALHLYRKGWSADGNFVEFDLKGMVPASWCKATGVTSAALPLRAMTGPEVLLEKCIQPLLDQVAKRERPKP